MSDFLIQTDKGAPQVELPVGEGFPKTGFIAPWTATVMYKVAWYEVDLQKEAEDLAALLPSNAEELLGAITVDGKSFDARLTSRAGDKFAYFYEDRERANQLQDYCHLNEPKDWKPSPQQVWYFETAVDSIYGLDDEAKEKFAGPVLSFDVRITTLRSKKYRHLYHMLALPSFVSAYAIAAGIKCPQFDLSPLTAPDDEVIFNAEMEKHWIGDADEGYEEALFWQERVKVWEALGEVDPQNFHTKAAGTKYSVESDQLDTLLEATVRTWTTPVNARLIPVPDPRLAAAYQRDDEKVRPSVPVIAQIFASAEEAEKVALAERPQKDESEGTEVVTTETVTVESGQAAVPAAWASATDQWVKQVKEIKDKLTGPPPTWGGQLKGLVDALGYDLGADLEELEAWIDLV